MDIWNKTDVAVRGVYQCMVKDFSRFENHPIMKRSITALFTSPSSFRAIEWPVLGDVSPYRFKIIWQLQHFLKRHRFLNDEFTDQDLARFSQENFIKCQVRLSEHKSRKAFILPVLQEARRIARSILGSSVDEERLRQGCRIGKRATLGSLLQQSYLDCKIGDPEALTCPSSLTEWFSQYLKSDPRLGFLVSKILADKGISISDMNDDVLNLVDVPKSWKSFRGISPLQLIALFYSYGYKDLVEEALDKHGLPIRKLQGRHQKRAKKYSKSRTHATVDLREASQSITSWLLNSVLPRAWYVALRPTFMRKIRFTNQRWKFTYCETVLPMGNAATFPVETLVFYCLIKAVGNLLGKQGYYSVYGDDLIYPCSIHPYVSAVFRELGLMINEDKSFADLSFFRESCGGDFYRGVDVRPALAPEYNGEQQSRLEYTAWLYKLYNSLKRRWHECELPSTFAFIESEIAFVNKCVYQVPPSYPDFAGIKTSKPIENWITGRLMPFRRLCLPQHLDLCTQDFHRWETGFYSLAITQDYRLVKRENVYYWDDLRCREHTSIRYADPMDTRALRWLLQPKSERLPWLDMRNILDFPEYGRSTLVLRTKVVKRRDGTKTKTVLITEPSKASPRLNNQVCTVINWT